MSGDIISSASLEPVTGEVVAPPPSPWRFGLRTLMAVMAVCSVQFALMSYVGVFPGVVLGLLLCCGTFGVIFLVGLVVPAGDDDRNLRRLDRSIVWLMAAILVLFFGTMLAGGGSMVLYAVMQARTEAWVQTQVGLTLRPIVVVEGADSYFAHEIVAVWPASPADRAGFRSGEVILMDGTRSDFGRLLEKNRGKEIDLTVSAGPLNLLSQPRGKRTLILAVP